MSGNAYQVLRNVPRHELLNRGFRKSQLASTAKTVTPTLVPGGVGDPATWQSLETPLPDALWREPVTGTIMLTPNALAPDFWENQNWVAWKLPKKSWSMGVLQVGSDPNYDNWLSVDATGAMHMRRSTPQGQAIPWTAGVALMLYYALTRTTMYPVMETKQALFDNQGWTVWVHPPGLFTDRATDYMDIAFGTRYILALRMNGTADLWLNKGTNDSNANWVNVQTFNFAAGGVDHNKPFQVTVIPWGFSYISFLFSQSSEPKEHRKANIRTARATYLYDLAQHEPENVYFNSHEQQYVKVPGATLVVSLRRYLFSYGVAFATVGYASSGIITFCPDVLQEAPSWTNPQSFYRGFIGQVDPQGGTTSISQKFVNEKGQTFNPSKDTNISNQFTLNASSGQTYTPELWSWDTTVPENVWTPPWSPVDISPNWQLLRFERNADPQVGKAELKYHRDADFGLVLTGPKGPLQFNLTTWSGTWTIYDGYVEEALPTLEGPLVTLTSTVHAKDMWLRLDECYVDNWKFFDGMGFVQVLVELIKSAGFTDADIFVNDPTGYLGSINFYGFTDPNDQKAINPESSIGDTIRELIKWYGGPQPIRIRWTALSAGAGGQWLIEAAPFWPGTTNPSYLPPVSFYLVSQGIPELTTGGAVSTSTQRWQKGQYLMQSNPEFSIQEQPFNALVGKTTTGEGLESEAMETFIPALLADKDSVNNPSSPWFIGRVKTKYIMPPELVMPSTQQELELNTRTYWDRYHHTRPVCEIKGEWQPELDVDGFIWLKGLDQNGDMASYGCWRIEAISVEATLDSRDEFEVYPLSNSVAPGTQAAVQNYGSAPLSPQLLTGIITEPNPSLSPFDISNLTPGVTYSTRPDLVKKPNPGNTIGGPQHVPYSDGNGGQPNPWDGAFTPNVSPNVDTPSSQKSFTRDMLWHTQACYTLRWAGPTKDSSNQWPMFTAAGNLPT